MVCPPRRVCALMLACVMGLVMLQGIDAARARGFEVNRHTSTRKLAQAPAGLCAVQGPAADSTWMNASSTCLKLWSTGAPIKAPADTATTKYGQIFVEYSLPVTAVFIDRNGHTYNISASANPPQDALQLERIWTMLLVQAELTDGNVTSFTPILYVPYKTIMQTMAGTTFEGLLFNSDPRPVGPEQYSWFRWTFSHNITVTNDTQKYGTLLHGTFDNLLGSVQDSKGNCQPALCADPAKTSDACKYYMEFFGNSTAMTLNWDPNMHMPVDTELVPMFDATHRQYMASFIELYNLMQPSYQFVPKRYQFISHGNPMGVPQHFAGVLSPATPIVYCPAP